MRFSVLVVRSIEIGLSRMTPCGLVNMYQILKESSVLRMHLAGPPKYFPIYERTKYQIPEGHAVALTVSNESVRSGYMCTVPVYLQQFYSNC